MGKLLLLLASVLVASFGAIGNATAGIITINFPSDLVGATPGGNFHNATADGFRISPSCHFDENVGPGLPGIGWDRRGCGPLTNMAYLGPPVPLGSGLYVDNNGEAFNLSSAFVLGAPFFAESSKGAAVAIPPGGSGATFDFLGADWSDIVWVLFYYDDPGVPAAGFNQLVVSVPEPSNLAAFVLILGLVGWWRYKQRGR